MYTKRTGNDRKMNKNNISVAVLQIRTFTCITEGKKYLNITMPHLHFDKNNFLLSLLL